MKYIRELKPEAFIDEEGELNERAPNPPRFDAPVQLETRGTTDEVTEADRDQFPEWQQALIWSKNTIYKNSVAAKLREFARTVEAEKLEKCHSIYTVAQCSKCGTVQKFPNRCDLSFCPECQPRLSNDRTKAVEWWTREISQPKHVVLTVVNLPEITKSHVQEFKRWFKNLRARKFCSNWIGGFYNIEVTNEGKGWHLHVHILVESKWIDARVLSEQWQSVTNGLGRIVKVKDARRGDYLKEVTKYAVKGVMLAAWTGEQIATFIDAFDGVRTFGVFGSLYGKRTEFAEWFKQIRDAKPKCKCGCCDIFYFTEAQFLERDFKPDVQLSTIPPPPDSTTMPLGLVFAHQYPR